MKRFLVLLTIVGFLGGCVSNGMMVSETNSNQIVCEKTMTGGDGVLAQMIVE